jgi:hypothetical protein
VVNLGFRNEVAEFYHRYRRGYPDAAIDALAGAFWLTGLDVVADLGCGTGQRAGPPEAQKDGATMGACKRSRRQPRN